MRWLPIALLALMLAALAWLAADLPRAGSDDEDETGPQPIVGAADTPPREHVFPMPGIPFLFDAGSDDAPPTPLIDSASARPAWAPSGDLIGRIVDSAGQPVSGAEVVALTGVIRDSRRGELSSNLTFVASARSDVSGRFEMPRAPSGEPIVLQVDGTRGRQALRRGLAALPDEVLDVGAIFLQDGAQVMGLVTDEEGRAVAGAEVILATPADFLRELGRRRGCDSPDEAPAATTRTTQTGAGGDFTIADAVSVRQELAVLAPGFTPWTGRFSLSPGEMHTLDVTLVRAVSIRGRTLDEQGQPVAGARVMAHVEDDILFACAESERDGRFELRDMQAKAHRVLAFAAGHGSAQAQRVDGGSQDVELVLRPREKKPGLIVQVSDEKGSPASGFELWTAFQDEPLPLGVSDDIVDGCVTLSWWSGINPGWLWAEARGRCSPLVKLPVSDPSLPVRLQLQACLPIEGRVIDAVTRVPIAGAELCASIPDKVRPGENRVWSTEDGRFLLDPLPPGQFMVCAGVAGYLENTFKIGQDAARPLELALTPCSTLVVEAGADWQRQLRGRAELRVLDSEGEIVLKQDCDQLPGVIPRIDAGHYIVELRGAGRESSTRSAVLGFDVPRSGTTRVDVSSLTLWTDSR